LVFVVIDGLDASGKNTQAVRLCTSLRSTGKTVFLRIHPSDDNFFGVRAKQFLYVSGKSAHFASAVFYMIDVVRSILFYSWRKYDYVVFVRYLMGTAYLPSPLDKIAYNFFACTVPTSNLMFFLDVSPNEAFRRIQATRGTRERFESLEELVRMRRKALSLALTSNWIIIEADKSVEDVAEALRSTLS